MVTHETRRTNVLSATGSWTARVLPSGPNCAGQHLRSLRGFPFPQCARGTLHGPYSPQGRRPCMRRVDACAGVQSVPIWRFRGCIGRIGRNGCCHGWCHGRPGRIATERCGIRTRMSFEIALKEGRLEDARAMVDELACEPDTGGLRLPECYADLAQAFDRRGQHDDAIAAMDRAIRHGWSGRPDPRCRYRLGGGIDWPPGRNEPCWCDGPRDSWVRSVPIIPRGAASGESTLAAEVVGPPAASRGPEAMAESEARMALAGVQTGSRRKSSSEADQGSNADRAPAYQR